jgi:AraC-like DNA-binding protein
MRDILTYLHVSCGEPLTLDSVSRRFGYTATHFSRLFNAYTGTNLSEYLNAVRADSAAALLKKGENATSAAMNSGFDSLRTFYRAFSRRYGVPPGTYVKNLDMP